MSHPFLDKVGEKYGDFTVTRILPIEELRCTLKELVHGSSGAHIMQLACDDPENLFCLAFQTLPSSANGAPHILEHTVLCGSHKFPVKDPFFAMNRRSLNTFMNALTGSDFTCYPAATQVEKDFYNLLEVYLDAVFHPELKELSFLQEGHRLEFTEPQNAKSPLEIKGIVYNEMKGSLASADNRLWYAMLALLCPDLPYAYNAGGNPKVIPKLTYQDLLHFHAKYYDPSRCLFFFYGNFPLKKHLDFIAAQTLDNVQKKPPLPPLPRQKRFTTPIKKEFHYPAQEGEDLESQTIFAFGWLTAPLVEQEDVLALTLLDGILMDTDASPLKYLLLESGLCLQVDAVIDTDMSEVPFAIICKGCAKTAGDELEKTLWTSLEKIAKEGIASDVVEAALHQLEFSRTEIGGDHSPFGLTLFMRSALAKQHGCPPENALKIHSLFNELRKKTENPDFLPNLIRKYFLENKHLVQLTLIPDPTLTSKEIAEEKEALQKIKEGLSEKEIDRLLKQASALKKYQKATEVQSLDCLPKVDLSDVPKQSRDLPVKEEEFQGMRIYHHDCFTNHIAYVDWNFEFPDIPAEDLPLVTLLTSLLSEIGCGDRNYMETLDYMQAHVGGINAFTVLYVQASNAELCRPTTTVKGKALARNTKPLFELLRDMATKPKFDNHKRIEELILKQSEALQSRLAQDSLRYATQLASSGFSVASFVQNQWTGLPYYKTILGYAKKIKTESAKICNQLAELHHRLFSTANHHLILSCDADLYAQIKKENFGNLATIPTTKSQPWKGNYSLPPVSSHATLIASPVAFTCESYRTASYLESNAPALSIASFLFENKVLHARIREEGGAYGSGTNYNPLSGIFHFYSFRDPQLIATLEAFQEAIREIADGAFDEQDLEAAKLGMIQQIDVPIPPGGRAMLAYGWLRDGRTRKVRQSFRDRLLALTKEDVCRAIKEEFLSKKGIAISFAGKELLSNQSILPVKPL